MLYKAEKIRQKKKPRVKASVGGRVKRVVLFLRRTYGTGKKNLQKALKTKAGSYRGYNNTRKAKEEYGKFQELAMGAGTGRKYH